MPTLAAKAAWKGSELAQDSTWIQHFAPADLAELDAALKAVRARGLPDEALTQAEFPLPGLGPKLVGTQSELISKIVNDPEELAEALAAGWKRTPAESVGKSASGVPNMAVVEAIATAGMPMPTPSTDMAKALDDANARINAMLEAMTKMQTAIEAMTSKAAPELLSQPAVPVSTVGKPTGKAAPVAASASDEE